MSANSYNLDDGSPDQGTRLNHPKLGEMELRYVSGRDTQEFRTILDQPEQNTETVIRQVLFHQLKKPELDQSSWEKLSSEDILPVLHAFVQQESHLFEDYKDTGEPYQDAFTVLDEYQRKELEELRVIAAPAITAAAESIRQFSDVYRTLLSAGSGLHRVIENAASIANAVNHAQTSLLRGFQAYSEVYTGFAQSLNLISSQIETFRTWTIANQSIFKAFNDHWTDILRQRQVAESTTVVVLAKYKWLITPSLPASIIFVIVKIDKEGRNDKAVNAAFVGYFEKNNWTALERMVESWAINPLIKKRLPILRDCVRVLKATKAGNTANVVLPTLISQIDGIFTDYMKSKGLPYRGDWRQPTGRITTYENNKPTVLNQDLDDLANEVFLNVLMQQSIPGQPLAKPFYFNRHKIMHGESVHYGKKAYMIRAFLVLDFLAHLS